MSLGCKLRSTSNLAVVPNQEHVQSIINAAYRLIEAAPNGRAYGDDVARAAGLDGNDARNAFKEAERQGQIACRGGWQGGMGLPYDVERP